MPRRRSRDATGGSKRKASAPWAWRDGVVDTAKEYFELRYRLASDHETSDTLLVARVSPPTGRTFRVEWCVRRSDPAHRDAVKAVRHELNFYLVELGEENRWVYAAYHCNTASNAYSRVHWSYFSPRAVTS
jgi:hypothetical protein